MYRWEGGPPPSPCPLVKAWCRSLTSVACWKAPLSPLAGPAAAAGGGSWERLRLSRSRRLEAPSELRMQQGRNSGSIRDQ